MQEEAEGYPDRIKEVTIAMKRQYDPIHGQMLPELEERKSKTRLKKEMIELQKLGEHLVTLPAAYLKKADIPHELVDAVISMKKMNTHGARRRQMQHIGVIMREVDPIQIKRVLDEFGQPRQTPEPLESDPDEPVQALINGGDEYIEDLLKRYPKADRTRLRQLVRNAKGEATKAGQTRALNALKFYLEEIWNCFNQVR
jgi:ribosome-associated protein